MIEIVPISDEEASRLIGRWYGVPASEVERIRRIRKERMERLYEEERPRLEQPQ